MGFLDLFARRDINAGVTQYQADPNGVLLDVRTGAEFAQGRSQGHIPGSRNLPLDQMGRARETLPDRSTHLYVYCYSGARSGQAVAALKRMGYDHVTNIGGIQTYRGKTKGGTTA